MADLKISALTASTTPLAGTEVLPIVQSSTTKQVSVANLTAGRAVSALTLALTSSGPVSQFNTGNTSSVRQQYINTGGTFQVGLDSSGGGIFGVPYAAVVWHGANYPVVVGVNNAEVGRFTSTGFSPVNGAGIDFSATSGTGTSELLADYEEGDFTPVPTASSGTITSYTLGTCNYTKVGRMVTVNFSVTITNAGTASGSLDVPLPFTNGAAIANGTGRENALTGSQLQSRVNASTATMNIQTYANTTAIATNAQIRATMTYFV
jgi:hypothetical protein